VSARSADLAQRWLSDLATPPHGSRELFAVGGFDP